MLKHFLTLLAFIIFINYTYAARDGTTGYNRGLNNKNISEINKLLDAKDYKKSIELIKKEIKKNKLNPDLFNYLGYAYRKKGDLELSIKSYKKALKLDPNHLEVHNYIGIAYLRKGEIEKTKLHLQTLKDLCKSKCDEYKNLEKELKEFLKK